MLSNRTSRFLLLRCSRGGEEAAALTPFRHAPLPSLLFPRGSVRFRCVLDHMAPRLVSACASLSSAVAAGNAIAAAGGPNAAHAAVTSAIAHVAVTAVAIASGACLSTKVDFLWPRGEDQPDSLILEGVDLTGFQIFHDPKVQKAIDFAKKAHIGQFRKTGDPYLTHCIHTGKILAALVPSSGKRAVNTVVAGILHDVIDDTVETLPGIKTSRKKPIYHQENNDLHDSKGSSTNQQKAMTRPIGSEPLPTVHNSLTNLNLPFLAVKLSLPTMPCDDHAQYPYFCGCLSKYILGTERPC